MGLFLVRSGGALIDHMPLLFALGVGVGMASDRDGIAALSALVSWLMIVSLLDADFVGTILPSLVEDPNARLAFEKIENPFIGILAGLVGAWCYDRFKAIRLPDWLAFFSGKRSAVIMSGLISMAVSAGLLVVWPLLFGGLVGVGQWIAGLGYVGAGIYAFLNRLLIPLGLHHALNNVFWFDTIGLGDLVHFWAGHTSADVSWSLGIYMSGFFPCMMFGVPGAALAMIRTAAPKRRKAAVGILASAALCSFVCGITEPFEFAFLFAAPVLYFLYALLYGVFTWIAAAVGFRAGFAFSGGVIDLVFSASLPAAQKTWLILPLGLAAFAVFYLVFCFLIRGFHLKTPGREEDPPTDEKAQEAVGIEQLGSSPEDGETVEGIRIAGILSGLGGKENIVSLDNCITRLRVEVADMSKVSDAALRSAGAKGVIRPGKTSVQVVIGLKVQTVADSVRKHL